MANGTPTLIEKALQGGAIFAICCVLLVGFYGFAQMLLPGVALTDKAYLDRTATAFEKLVELTHKQSDVLDRINQSTSTTANNTGEIREKLRVAPLDVMQAVDRFEKKFEDRREYFDQKFNELKRELEPQK